MISAKSKILTAFALTAFVLVTPADAKDEKLKTRQGMLTFYSGQKLTGDYFEVVKDRTSISADFFVGSIAVFKGETWEVCEGSRFKGPCMTVTDNMENLGEITIRSARKLTPAPAG